MHDGKGGCHDRGEQVDGTKCTGAVWTYERFLSEKINGLKRERLKEIRENLKAMSEMCESSLRVF